MRRVRRLAPLAVAAFVLSSCAEHAPQNVFSPEGSQAETINDLQKPVFYVAGIVGIIVFAAIGYVMVRFRKRKGDDGTEPVQVEGRRNLEVAWTIGPFLILLPIAVATVGTVLHLASEPKNAMRISVYGQQWWWSYQYDIDGDGKTDIVTANDLVIPAGEKIVLDIQARDVIHSFWIPALAGTADALPGGENHPLVFQADHPGVYFGQCKEYCGLSHANMRARTVALTKADFATWAAQQIEPATMPDATSDPVAYAGMVVFREKCATCHDVNGLLDADGQPVPNPEGHAPLVSGYAPNLTHLMSRGIFASGNFALYVTNPASGKLELNRPQLERWLRDPPAMLPMAADEGRGMPNLHLTDTEIDELVAFLSTLGPAPPENG
jgi:cytochrome c oxidase subunit 2